METDVFTDTVEDDHGIVDGVTDNGQDGCDKRLVDFQSKRQYAPEEWVKRECNKGIVSQRNQTAQTILPFSKTNKPPDQKGVNRFRVNQKRFSCIFAKTSVMNKQNTLSIIVASLLVVAAAVSRVAMYPDNFWKCTSNWAHAS